MKFKKAIAAIAAAAMALSAMSTGANAAATGVMDFEDGTINSNIIAFTPDAVIEGVTQSGDEASGVLSVADYNGSKMLKFACTDADSKVIKIRFDVKAMFGDDLDKITNIKMDVICASADGVTPPNWTGGCLQSIGSDAAGEAYPAEDQSTWEGGEYTNAATVVMPIEKKWLLPAKKWKLDAASSTLVFMKWSQSAGPANVDVYIDNIQFLDADGNGVAFAGSAAPAADTAPAADSGAATTAPATGNAPIAIAATVVVLAGVSMIVSRKRK
ncbi:MAG: hypothetical protein LBM87_05535 [Ruminococcus sp.]|nr:hypothetical protein [Ruminococcus sp.]